MYSIWGCYEFFFCFKFKCFTKKIDAIKVKTSHLYLRMIRVLKIELSLSNNIYILKVMKLKWKNLGLKPGRYGVQDYKVTVPFENYTESGYLLEVFIDGNKVRSSEYTFLKNNIKIIDQTK